MAKLLFRMRHVPEDEAAEVRELLETNQIEFFETYAGSWGISLPALWLKNESQYAQARALLDDYQAERGARTRAEYQSQLQRGEGKTSWHFFKEDPFRYVAYVIAIVLVLYLSLQFFLSL